MGDKGWTCPIWPAEYGGGGLSKDENKILQEEMSAMSARSPLEVSEYGCCGPASQNLQLKSKKKNICLE